MEQARIPGPPCLLATLFTVGKSLGNLQFSEILRVQWDNHTDISPADDLIRICDIEEEFASKGQGGTIYLQYFSQ